MRVLLLHNYYQWPGGEDHVFEAEAELLRTHGHAVLLHTDSNDRIGQIGQIDLARKTVWNNTAYREVRALCRSHRAEVVHLHNTFPLLSPATYYAARSEGAAVVQTLHNYRLLCPATTFFRNGKVCEDCLGRTFAWPSTLHACYRGSRSASAAVAVLVATHRLLRTWQRGVDIYVALTEFSRRKLIEGGLPARKIARKPNFLPVDPGEGTHRGAYALFVGRLSEEKGVQLLLQAWTQLAQTFPLKIVGDGPLASLLEPAPPGVEWLGQRSKQEVFQLMKDASFLVFPSQWYETFGLVIIEAFATGLPVLAAELGAAAELVDPGRTGIYFRAGDVGSLAAGIASMIERPEDVAAMGRRARAEFLERYTADSNYDTLLDIYRRAIRSRVAGQGATAALRPGPPRFAEKVDEQEARRPRDTSGRPGANGITAPGTLPHEKFGGLP